MLEQLRDSVKHLGRPQWRPMLTYLANLHEESLHPPCIDLPYRWEEIAPGSSLGVQFGSWDTVHIALDAVASDPQHALYQILNLITLQQYDGMLPSTVRFLENRFHIATKTTFPPLWPAAIQDYIELTKNLEPLKKAMQALEKQIDWFEHHRRAEGGGFYYLDYLDRFWESGVEEGVRYEGEHAHIQPLGCIDATSHLFFMYVHAAAWSELLGQNNNQWMLKAKEVMDFIQTKLFDKEIGFFFDRWVVGDGEMRRLSFEGLWPLIVGAATFEQAQRLIDDHLIEPTRFLSEHPLATVAQCDPYFDYWGWRGPVRNSMTYWAARGCYRYGRHDAAAVLLERALNQTERQFEATGKLWEFYHPHGGSPLTLTRDRRMAPIQDYLGHNPLIAMAQLWEILS